MSNEITATPDSFVGEVQSYWQRLPNKGFFLAALAAWLALFQFFGNATLGYTHTPSLYHWMYAAYNNPSSLADDSHGDLIPAAVLVLMWWKRKELFAQPPQLWAPGLTIMAAALLLHLFGFLIEQTRVSILALFLGIYGLMGLAWGRHWLRASVFPWFLFLFSVPLGTATEVVTFPLRLSVTRLVALICNYIIGIGVVADGTRLSKPPSQYQYEVAAACSGMRSLVAITAVAIIYAFMILPGWWKKAVLIASALPLAVIGNTFRLLVIVITAEISGQEAGQAVHDSWFWSMLPYLPGMLGLVLIGRWLERCGPKTV